MASGLFDVCYWCSYRGSKETQHVLPPAAQHGEAGYRIDALEGGWKYILRIKIKIMVNTDAKSKSTVSVDQQLYIDWQ